MNRLICLTIALFIACNTFCAENMTPLQEVISQEIAWIESQKHNMFEDIMDAYSLGGVNIYLDRLDNQMLYARIQRKEDRFKAIAYLKAAIEAQGSKTISEVKELLQRLLSRSHV